jgi:hypothetical protein
LKAEYRHSQTIFTFIKRKDPINNIIEMGESQGQGSFHQKSKSQSKKPVYIANAYSGQLVHKWRRRTSYSCETQTAIDNP